MKLKLDTMIIQKGRAQSKNTALGKDDLKDMVNYGADAIFDMGSDVEDEDIEKIIKEGEEKARNLDVQAEKMLENKFNMLNFEMNSCNLYEFEDIDYL
jgi:SWI/SNF-related matrix-associated actin-dependent regulator of chromatin subfamily A member 5